MQCNITRYNARQYHTIQYNAMEYNTIQCNAIQCNTIRYNAIKYHTIQNHTIQYNTIQYNTIQCNTIQHKTILHISGVLSGAAPVLPLRPCCSPGCNFAAQVGKASVISIPMGSNFAEEYHRFTVIRNLLKSGCLYFC